MTLKKFDAASWDFLQKVVRIGHNRRVKKHFRDVIGDESVDNGRSYLKSALSIRNRDSALEVLVKLLYFKSYLSQDNEDILALATVPEAWPLKAERIRTQLAIIYRPTDKDNKSGNYTLNIPHYNGDRTPQFPSYIKGNYWAQLTLSDNSHTKVNAKSKAEAIRVTNALKRYIKSDYLTNHLTTGSYANKRFKEIRVSPIRADYYPTGDKNITSQWVYYF